MAALEKSAAFVLLAMLKVRSESRSSASENAASRSTTVSGALSLTVTSVIPLVVGVSLTVTRKLASMKAPPESVARIVTSEMPGVSAA